MSDEAKTIRPILDGKVQGAEFVRTVYHATSDLDTTFEDVVRPEYWVHVARRLRPLDEIVIVSEDASWYARLLVVGSAGNNVRVKAIEYVDFSATEVKTPPGYEIKYAGRIARFRVTRKTDGHVLQEGLQTREDAEAWLATFSL